MLERQHGERSSPEVAYANSGLAIDKKSCVTFSSFFPYSAEGKFKKLQRFVD